MRSVVDRSKDQKAILIALFLHQCHPRRGYDAAAVPRLLQSRQANRIASQVVAHCPFIADNRLHIEHGEILISQSGHDRSASSLRLREAEMV